MTRDQFKALQPGDSIRHVEGNGPTYIVTSNYGDRITGVTHCDATNPAEWELVVKRHIETDAEAAARRSEGLMRIAVEVQRQMEDDDNYSIADWREQVIDYARDILNHIERHQLSLEMDDLDEFVCMRLKIMLENAD